MPKQTTKAKSNTKTKTASKKRASTNTAASHGVRPSVGIIFTLAIALFITITFSIISFSRLRTLSSDLATEKLAVFNHLAESYINDMEYTSNDKPTIKQMTGYGVSNEDGVFYITFDFYPYDVVDHNLVPDGDVRHGIIYFWEDKDNGTYSHAFSYHDDASYHPDGTYVKIEP